MKRILFLHIVVLLSFHFLKAQDLTVASFNIRYHNQSDSLQGNGWHQRKSVVCDLIRFHGFEIVGAQEVLHDQLQDMLAGLPGYSYVGVGRDDGKTQGEYAPIFFTISRVKLLNNGHFWLSEITDKPNKGWDAALPRICTWAKFKDLKSGQSFFFFNLHMDHIGVEARKNSAKLVLQKITEMCGKSPVILAGDFNVDQSSPNYAVLESSDLLDDAFLKTQIRYAENGTFNGFEPSRFTESRIDHIFVSPSVAVKRYAVLTDTYRTPIQGNQPEQSGNFPAEVSFTTYQARTPSDHFPVMVVLSFKH